MSKGKSYGLFPIIIIVLCYSSSSFAQSSLTGAKHKAEIIDSLVTHYFNTRRFNGTVLVSEKGSVIYQKAFGLADFDRKEVLTENHQFYLASVSKQFTAFGIMLLKSEGKLNYENKLSEYFPEFPPYASKISIGHLLTHTSGIPDHLQLGLYKDGLTNSEVLEFLLKLKAPRHFPGERFQYSNAGYVLLAMIIEKISGQSFDNFMKLNILEPAGMKNTLVYTASNTDLHNRAIGHSLELKKDDYCLLTFGAGGMYSTIGDLYKWDQFLYSENLVQKQEMQLAFSPYVLTNGQVSNYGYGWSVDSEKSTVEHGGALSGFRASIKRYLTEQSCYIILSNIGDTTTIEQLRNGLDNILTSGHK